MSTWCMEAGSTKAQSPGAVTAGAPREYVAVGMVRQKLCSEQFPKSYGNLGRMTLADPRHYVLQAPL